jgi:hypothetical protein
MGATRAEMLAMTPDTDDGEGKDHLNLDAEGHEGAYRVPQAQQLSFHAVLAFARNIKVKL